MATEVTYTIDPGGSGDYKSMQAFAADAKDLVTLDQTVLVKCKSSNGVADTEQVKFAGWTTDANHTITIVPADSNSHHKGVWNDSIYRLEVSPDLSYAIEVEDVEHIRFRGLQISGGGHQSTNWDSVISVLGSSTKASDGLEISGCIIRPGKATKFYEEPAKAQLYLKSFCLLMIRRQNRTSGQSFIKVFNNLFLSTALVGKVGSLPCLISRPVFAIIVGHGSNKSTFRVYVDNNTFHKHATGIYSYHEEMVEARNNLFHMGRGPLEDIDGVISTSTTTHNATTRGILSKSGTGSRIGQTFTFEDVAKEDFRLKPTDKGAKNAGTDHENLPTGLLSTHDPFNAPETPVDVSMSDRPPGCEGADLEPVEGCTDPEALNYNGDATVDDGSCEYPKPVCKADKLFTLAAKFGPGVEAHPTTGDERFHNAETPFDVTNNGIIDSADASAVTSYLNTQGNDLPTTRPETQPLADINNNGSVSPSDAVTITNAVNAHGPIRVKDLRVLNTTDLTKSTVGTKFTNNYETASKVWAKLSTIDQTKVRGKLTGHDPYDSTDTAGPEVDFDDFRNPISFVIEKDPALTEADANSNSKGYIYWITVNRPPHNETTDDGGSGNAKVHANDFSGRIWQAKLDGTEPRILYDDLVNPCDITIDSKGHLYWTERLRTNADEGVGQTSQAGFGLYSGFIMRGRRSQEESFSYGEKDIFVVIPATTWEPAYKSTNWPVNDWPLATNYGTVLEDKVNRNPSNPFDVNNDAQITAADQVAITDKITAGTALSATPTAFYDVTGDGWVSPVDSLYVSYHRNKFDNHKYARGALGYGSYPAGIDYDPVSEKLYWCDAEKRAIYSARVLGGQHSVQKVEKLVDLTYSQPPKAPADPVIRAEERQAGQSYSDVDHTPIAYGYCPYGIAVDGDSHHIYFSKGVIIIPPQGASETDANYHDHDDKARDKFSISRVNTDGTDEVKLDGDIASAPLSLALDSKNKKLYYPHASGLSSYVSDATQIANAGYSYYEGRESIFDGTVFDKYGNKLTLTKKVGYEYDEAAFSFYPEDAKGYYTAEPVYTTDEAKQSALDGSGYATPAAYATLRKGSKSSPGAKVRLYDESIIGEPITYDLSTGPKSSASTDRSNSTYTLAFRSGIPLGAEIVSAKLKCQFYERDYEEGDLPATPTFTFKSGWEIKTFLEEVGIPISQNNAPWRPGSPSAWAVSMPHGDQATADAICRLKGYKQAKITSYNRCPNKDGKNPGGWHSPSDNSTFSWDGNDFVMHGPNIPANANNYGALSDKTHHHQRVADAKACLPVWGPDPVGTHGDKGLNVLINDLAKESCLECSDPEEAPALPMSGSAIHHRIYGDLTIVGDSLDLVNYVPYCTPWHPYPNSSFYRTNNQRKPTSVSVPWYNTNLPRIRGKEPVDGVYPASNDVQFDLGMTYSPELKTLVQEIVSSGGDNPQSDYSRSLGLIRLMLVSQPQQSNKRTNCTIVSPHAVTAFWEARIPQLEVTYRLPQYKDSGIPNTGLVRATISANGLSEKVYLDTGHRRIEYLGLDDQWFLGGGGDLPCDPTEVSSSSTAASNVVVVDESLEVDAYAYYDKYIFGAASHLGDSDNKFSNNFACSGRKCPRWGELATAVDKLENGPQTITFTYSFILDNTVSDHPDYPFETIRDYYDGGTYHGFVFPSIAGAPTNADFKTEIVASFAEWKAVLEKVFNTTNGFKNNLTVNFTNLGDETGTSYPAAATWVGDPDGKGKGGYALPGTQNLGDIRIGMRPLDKQSGILAIAGTLDFSDAITNHTHTAKRVLGEVGDYGADITFDQLDLWRKDATTRAGAMSIKKVAVHEIGHSLGLYPDAYDGESSTVGGNSGHDPVNGPLNIMHYSVTAGNYSSLFPSGLANAEIMDKPNGLTEVLRALYGGPPTNVTQLKGCTDPKALNYDKDAKQDDGTCKYEAVIKGCTDFQATNYDENANCDDGTCEYPEPDPSDVPGCMDPLALNYNASATVSDGSCVYDTDVIGCMDPDATNFNPNATKSAKADLFWVEYDDPTSTGNIGKLDLNAGTNSYIFSGSSDGINQPVDLVHYKDKNNVQDYVYFTEENGGSGRIYRGKEDGAGAPIVIVNKTDLGLTNFYPQGITVDEDNGYIFFIEGKISAGGIWRCDLDGNGLTKIVSSVNNGYGITYERKQKRIYWTEGASNGVIKFATYAGASPTTLATQGVQLYGLDLYYGNGTNANPTYIIWTTNSQIRRASLKGSGTYIANTKIRSLHSDYRHVVVDSFDKRVYFVGKGVQYNSAFSSAFDLGNYKILSISLDHKGVNQKYGLTDWATEPIVIEHDLPTTHPVVGIGMDTAKACTYATTADCLDIGFHESKTSTTVGTTTGSVWTNPKNIRDVNNDGCVDSADVQLVLDALNTGVADDIVYWTSPVTGEKFVVCEKTASGDLAFSSYRPPGAPYLDVNGDGFLSPIDSLVVISYINDYGTDGKVCYDNIDEDCNDYMESQPGVIFGCTDPAAQNYSSTATKDDGSCVYVTQDILGCKDSSAVNYNPKATKDDGSCIYKPANDPCPVGSIDKIVNGTFDAGLTSWTALDDYGLGLPTWDSDTKQASLVYRSILRQTVSDLKPGSSLKVSFDYMQDYSDNQVVYVDCILRGSSLNKLAAISVPFVLGEDNSFSVTAIVPSDGKVVIDFLTPTFPHDCGNPPRPHIDNVEACSVPIVLGCTDPLALNYNPNATDDDGSCTYKETDAPCEVDLSRVDELALTNDIKGFPKQDFSAVANNLSLPMLQAFTNSVTKVREHYWTTKNSAGDSNWQISTGNGLRFQGTHDTDTSVKYDLTYNFGTPAANLALPHILIPYKGSTIQLTYRVVKFSDGGAEPSLVTSVLAVYSDGTEKLLASKGISLAGDYKLDVTIPDTASCSDCTDTTSTITHLQIKFSPKPKAKSEAHKLTVVIDDVDVHCCSCKEPDPNEKGCTDPKACNYNPDAKIEDGSCTYPAEGDCDEVVYSTWGRYQLGVDQTQGGEKYPFVNPSSQLGKLIADLYLAYLDDEGTYTPPFKIDWLSGFGCLPEEDSDACGLPPSQYNMQISDAKDNIVYVTTAADKFTQVEWNTYYRVLEWVNADGELLRVVIFTAWSDSATTPLLGWKTYFEPANSQLDARAYERIPRRITKISVVNPYVNGKIDNETTVFEQGLDENNNANIILSSGHNLISEIDNPDLVDGGKYLTALNFDAIPGAGLGKLDDCEELTKQVYRINGIAPNELGQFLTDAGECYRVERVPQAMAAIPSDTLTYNDAKVAGSVSESSIQAPNGLVHSRLSTNVLYTHNKKGDVGRIFAIAPLGTLLGTYNIVYGSTHANAGQVVTNTDFRDITIGDGNLFIADTGDETLTRDGTAAPKPIIYQVAEPTTFTATTAVTTKIFEVSFSDNKKHDVAAIAFDPVDGDLYLFTKETTAIAGTDPHYCYVYKIESADMLNAELNGVVPVTAKKDVTIGPINWLTWINAGGISAADISSDGRMIILRDTAEYNINDAAWTHHAKYWKREIGESVASALNNDPKDAKLPAVVDEPHGTGIAFDPDVNDYSYYTIGESITPTIYEFVGTSTTPGTMVITPGTLKVSNDCGPCCDCQDFINVYEAIRKLITKYNELGKRAEAIRDLFKLNIDRWETSKTCRAGQNLRIVSHAVPVCRAALGFGVCNNTSEKITDVTLTIDFAGSDRAGRILANTTVRNGNEGPTPADRTEVYELEGSWPTYTAHFDCISPGGMGQITTMMKFPDCVEGDTIKVKLTSNLDSTVFISQEHSFNLEQEIDVIEESTDCPEHEDEHDPQA